MKLINKKWKVVNVKRNYDKIIIVHAGWKCSCDKEDGHYKREGCSCHVTSLYGIGNGWDKRETCEHIVALHNASIDNN